MAKVTVNGLEELPPFIDLMTAAEILGIGRTKAYELARAGKFPVRVVMVGANYKVPVRELIRLQGAE